MNDKKVLPPAFFFLASYREEEESLRDKIRADHERALQEAKEKLRKSREDLQAEIQTEKNKVMEDLKKKDVGQNTFCHSTESHKGFLSLRNTRRCVTSNYIYHVTELLV